MRCTDARLAIAALLYCSFLSGCTDRRVRFAEFPDDKDGAISFTFDDNAASCFTTIAPHFKAKGVTATFFVIPGNISKEQWGKWRELNSEGFEIGNHTLSHPDLAKIEDRRILDNEINGAFDSIANEIGVPPFSFAHPFHHTSDLADEIVFQKHFASRMSPSGFCDWWEAKTEKTTGMFDEEIEGAIENHRWFVVSAHGVNDGWSPVNEKFLDDALDEVTRNKDRLIVETFGNLARYKIEREKTEIRVGDKGGELQISMVNSLDHTVFNYPLTLIVEDESFVEGRVSVGADCKIQSTRRQGKKLLITLSPRGSIRIQRTSPQIKSD